MIEVKVSKNNRDICEYADLALKHRLYVSGWDLSSQLQTLRDTRTNKYNAFVVLAFKNDVPIGVLICTAYKYWYSYQIFVRKSERNKGVADKMIQNAPHFDSEQTGEGLKGTRAFWYKMQRHDKGL